MKITGIKCAPSYNAVDLTSLTSIMAVSTLTKISLWKPFATLIDSLSASSKYDFFLDERRDFATYRQT